MANLTENNTWEDGVYQIETTDPVIGGPDGVDNQPHKQLTNRTAYLKERLDSNVTKQPVRVATTAQITLATEQGIDGITVVAGERVLVKNQSVGADNGIYVAASGPWSRAEDQLATSIIVPVSQGTENADSLWMLTTDSSITPGTTALTFANVVESGMSGQVQTAVEASGQIYDRQNDEQLTTAIRKLGDRGWKNYIINGCMRIAQRGTSFSNIASGEYTLDRFQYNKGPSGSMVHTINQSTDVPVGQYGNSLAVECTTADTSIASSDWCSVDTKVEGYNIRNLLGRQITLSFWAKSSISGTYCVSLRNINVDRCMVLEYTINSVDTWERKELTFTLEDIGSWGVSNGVGLRIGWVLACGSDLQAPAGTWQTSNCIASDSQVNACASSSAGNNFKLCNIQLEEGSIATDFEHRPLTIEEALCHRYYWQISGDNNPICVGCAYTISWWYGVVTFPQPMRIIPITSIADDGVDIPGNGTGYTSISAEMSSTTLINGELRVNTPVTVQNASMWARINNDAVLRIDAEL